MTALIPVEAARSSRLTISARCWAGGSLGREGLSRLWTVAINVAPNSYPGSRILASTGRGKRNPKIRSRREKVRRFINSINLYYIERFQNGKSFEDLPLKRSTRPNDRNFTLGPPFRPVTGALRPFSGPR